MLTPNGFAFFGFVLVTIVSMSIYAVSPLFGLSVLIIAGEGIMGLMD